MQPLAGVRVIDVTQIYQGPYCSFLMAMAGAEVIKIEPLTGERTRRYELSEVPPMNFAMLNSNKQSVTLNLKKPAGVDLLKQLVKDADVLIENFAPGVMDRLGVGYQSLRKINPQLIYASGTGYGLSGPDRDLLAMDHTVQADGGLMSTTGEKDGPPARAGGTPVDFLGGTHLHAGILQALIAREKSGKGTLVESAMIESLYFVLTSQINNVFRTGKQAPRRGDKSGSQTSPYGRYVCKDEKYLVLTAVAETHWDRILTVIGREELKGNLEFGTRLKRYERDHEVNQMIEGWTREHTRDDAIAILREHKIPSAPVRSVSEVMEDPHMHKRGMLKHFHHPKLGDVVLPRSPINLSEHEMPELTFYPNLGEHNRSVLADLLGLSDSDIKILESDGVIKSS